MDEEDTQMTEEAVDAQEETSTSPGAFVPPSIDEAALLAGDSYDYFSPVPPGLLPPPSGQGQGLPCALGVDEAGRGPVLGPMVYGVFYLPLDLEEALLRDGAHRFDDSKALTPAVRSALMEALCTPSTSSTSSSSSPSPSTTPPSDLHSTCGWATSLLSARAISSGMQRPPHAPAYNLNAQALDATASLIRGVLARGVDLRAVYVDTVGPPASHQKKLERLFPGIKMTVAKKADSLYPCVSAASVCAKVTRDAALEVLYRHRSSSSSSSSSKNERSEAPKEADWGSGYPSDARCVSWLRRNMHPVFGWGPECRFSWGTAKDMLDAAARGGGGVAVEWPADDGDPEASRVTDFFVTAPTAPDEAGAGAGDELGTWFGTPAGLEAF